MTPLKKKSILRQPQPDLAAQALQSIAEIQNIINSIDINNDDKFKTASMLLGRRDPDSIIKGMQILREIVPNDVETAEEAERIIVQQVDSLAADRHDTDADIQRIIKAMRKAEKKHGLADDEYFPLDEMPDDLRLLNAQYDRRHREISAEIFRQHGEHELADIHLDDDRYEAWESERMKVIEKLLEKMEK